VNMPLLREWADGMDLTVEELVGRYVKSVTRDLELIEQKAAAGDVSEVFRIAHGAASASANCGMRAILEPLHRLELGSREGSLDNVRPLVEESRHQLSRMLAAMADRPDGTKPAS
jgi:HPt (histidine-containing phosphotransfer) domain-containing protein